jgi:hypothetical protein
MSAADQEREHLIPRGGHHRGSLGERVRGEDSYGLLLLMILLSLLLTGLVGEGRLGRLILTVTSGVMALFAFWTSRPPARVLRWAVIGVVTSVVAASVALLASGTALEGTSRALIALLTAASPVVVARRLLHHPRVQGATILGALCIYLLLGLFYAYLFGVFGINSPFFVQTQHATMVDYLYFSYVTLATVGYGDLTAATDIGRVVAISEALMGQLYLVTVVSLLVANLGRDRIRGDRS